MRTWLNRRLLARCCLTHLEAELLAFPPKIQRQIRVKIARLQGGFSAQIKKLNAADNIYRLSSGNFRILFDAEGATIVIRTIRDRKDAYE